MSSPSYIIVALTHLQIDTLTPTCRTTGTSEASCDPIQTIDQKTTIT